MPPLRRMLKSSCNLLNISSKIIFPCLGLSNTLYSSRAQYKGTSQSLASSPHAYYNDTNRVQLKTTFVVLIRIILLLRRQKEKMNKFNNLMSKSIREAERISYIDLFSSSLSLCPHKSTHPAHITRHWNLRARCLNLCGSDKDRKYRSMYEIMIRDCTFPSHLLIKNQSG